jgi:hypothetical protein
VHTVARFTRFAVANPVWQHDEKFCRVEWLIFSKQLAGKLGPNELRAVTCSSMHDENRIRRFALCIFLRFSQRAIVNPQFRQSFTRLKFEIANCEIALSRRGIICGGCDTGNHDR